MTIIYGDRARLCLTIESEPIEVTIGGGMPGGPPPEMYPTFTPGAITATLTVEAETFRLTRAEAERFATDPTLDTWLAIAADRKEHEQ